MAKRWDLEERWRWNEPQIKKLFFITESLMKIHVPHFVKKIDSFGVSSSMFTARFFPTCFVDCLPFPVVLRIWDCLFARGPSFFFAIIVAIFKLVEGLSIPDKNETMNE